MFGRIIKGIAGFYYVCTDTGVVYECKARGSFRNAGIKPLIGDFVAFQILEDSQKTGSISSVLQRKNALIRPAAANIDQAVILCTISEPELNYNLLDRFLIYMEKQEIKVLICLNKMDLVKKEEAEYFQDVYRASGYPVLLTSARMDYGIKEFRQQLSGKTTVMAGPSGVGKSTLLNQIKPEALMETGGLSSKLQRGKHTTRHTELVFVSEGTYLLDTPGFTSLTVTDIQKDTLRFYIPELAAHEGNCRYRGCMHINEPGCSVKEALKMGKIALLRYEHYLQLYEELQTAKKFNK